MSEGGAFFSLYLRYDNKYEIYERKVYSVLELLGDIGGLLEAIYVMGYILVGFFTHRLFVS